MNVNDRLYRERVYAVVRQIPKGHVMTYGQLATELGEGYTPRTVGYVMHGADEDVPWHRVINSQGKCSTGRLTIPIDLQQELLEGEGIVFSSSGKCDMKLYQWFPAGTEPIESDQIDLFVA